MNTGSIYKWPAILGLVFGVVFSIPGLNLINCFCCIGVVACGFVTALVRSREAAAGGQKFDVASGAIAGLVAGVVYGLVSGILGSIVSVMAPGVMVSLMESMRTAMENAEGVPPESLDQIDDAIDKLKNGSLTAIGIVWGVVQGLVLGCIFSTIGGLIGGAVFKKDAQVEIVPPAPNQEP